VSLAERFRFEPNIRTVKAGDMLFAEGDPASEMYVVLDGAIDIRIGGRTIEVIEGATMIGEMALIDRGARSASVWALRDTTIVPIDSKRFLYLVQNTPTFALEVMTMMVARLRHTDAMIALVHEANADAHTDVVEA